MRRFYLSAVSIACRSSAPVVRKIQDPLETV